ncbi:unnamed protein product [Haemonchus placei]|uniref:Uncharacterized protein n=1 Tax=Haemonchus placei TaxID=6290 RepID=A0A3P7VRD6_HAEPC|nr:unnamed protein product [Haemonchus placei]
MGSVIRYQTRNPSGQTRGSTRQQVQIFVDLHHQLRHRHRCGKRTESAMVVTISTPKRPISLVRSSSSSNIAL